MPYLHCDPLLRATLLFLWQDKSCMQAVLMGMHDAQTLLRNLAWRNQCLPASCKISCSYCNGELQEDGQPGHLEACKGLLLLFTTAKKLCLWRLRGQEATPFAGSGKLVDLPPDLTVISIRCNCDGSKVTPSSNETACSVILT